MTGRRPAGEQAADVDVPAHRARRILPRPASAPVLAVAGADRGRGAPGEQRHAVRVDRPPAAPGPSPQQRAHLHLRRAAVTTIAQPPPRQRWGSGGGACVRGALRIEGGGGRGGRGLGGGAGAHFALRMVVVDHWWWGWGRATSRLHGGFGLRFSCDAHGRTPRRAGPLGPARPGPASAPLHVPPLGTASAGRNASARMGGWPAECLTDSEQMGGMPLQSRAAGQRRARPGSPLACLSPRKLCTRRLNRASCLWGAESPQMPSRALEAQLGVLSEPVRSLSADKARLLSQLWA